MIAIYGIFAVAATARAGVQIGTRFAIAPVSFLLSAAAGLLYLLATVALLRGSVRWLRVARVVCVIELSGVILVGGLSFLWPKYFPETTVWSHFGQGYGFIPLVLPIAGLAVLRRNEGLGRR